MRLPTGAQLPPPRGRDDLRRDAGGRRASSVSILSTASAARSCSHTRSGSQPAASSSASVRASRSRMLASFTSHHARLAFGTCRWRGQECQKQPSTNTATRRPRSTTSARRRRLVPAGVAWADDRGVAVAAPPELAPHGQLGCGVAPAVGAHGARRSRRGRRRCRRHDDRPRHHHRVHYPCVHHRSGHQVPRHTPHPARRPRHRDQHRGPPPQPSASLRFAHPDEPQPGARLRTRTCEAITDG